MSAQQLAEKMSAVGIGWDRSIVANLENGRRATVSVEEFLALAYVLDVAPVYLLLPVDDETAHYAYTPNRTAEVWRVREWVRGHPYAAAPSIGLGGVDRRGYLSEVPAVELAYPPKPPTPLQTVKVVPESGGSDGDS